MLTSVPQAVANVSRQVALRHPNSMECSVWRKVVTRVEIDPETEEPSEMGGAPTMGGMGVLRHEDEEEIEFVELGEAKCLFCGVYAGSELSDRENQSLLPNAQETQIEALKGPGEEGHFTADSGDLVLVILGFGVVVAFEVVGQLTSSNFPPYVRRYVINPRDDLHALEPFLNAD